MILKLVSNTCKVAYQYCSHDGRCHMPLIPVKQIGGGYYKWSRYTHGIKPSLDWSNSVVSDFVVSLLSSEITINQQHVIRRRLSSPVLGIYTTWIQFSNVLVTTVFLLIDSALGIWSFLSLIQDPNVFKLWTNSWRVNYKLPVSIHGEKHPCRGSGREEEILSCSDWLHMRSQRAARTPPKGIWGISSPCALGS